MEINKEIIESIRNKSFSNTKIGKRFIMRKAEFQRLMKACGSPKEYTFTYDANGNDEPMSMSHGTTAMYDLHIHAGGTSILLCWKSHRRIHEEVEKELVEMYSRWADELTK